MTTNQIFSYNPDANQNLINMMNMSPELKDYVLQINSKLQGNDTDYIQNTPKTNETLALESALSKQLHLILLKAHILGQIQHYIDNNLHISTNKYLMVNMYKLGLLHVKPKN